AEEEADDPEERVVGNPPRLLRVRAVLEVAEEAHVEHSRGERPAGNLEGPPRGPVPAGPHRAVDEQDARDPVVEQEGQEGPVAPAAAGLGEGEEDPESKGQARAGEGFHGNGFDHRMRTAWKPAIARRRGS